jgi:hypothetical protein
MLIDTRTVLLDGPSNRRGSVRAGSIFGAVRTPIPVARIWLGAAAAVAALGAVNVSLAVASRGGVLSDETTLSRWAASVSDSPVYRDPSYSSRRVGRLRAYTEDGFSEVYLLLRSRVDSRGREWIRLRLPQRPNGTMGWVRREALGSFHVVRTRLVVDRHSLRATLFSRGHHVWSAPVGVGKPSTPTPAGRFWIREGFHVHGNSIYGPYAFGTADYSVLSDWPGGGVIGIHGTNQPGLVPGRPSHGCIRMHNSDISWLSRHLPIGTPLEVR